MHWLNLVIRVVVIRAQTVALMRLARGEDDADRLFFERQLVMEGDTEFALLVALPILAIYLFLERYLVGGLTAGSEK